MGATEEGYSTSEGFNEIWRIQNNRLIHAEWIWPDGRRTLYKEITYNSNGLTVTFNGFTRYFYDIPEIELIDIFLQKYVNDIFELLLNNNNLTRIRNNNNANRYNDILKLLSILKKQELAIIRNCIFAKYQYSFQTQYWKDFINKYYLNNYNGIYTNAETMEKLSENEKWLLDLIIEYERRLN